MIRFFIRWSIRFGLFALAVAALFWLARNAIGKAVVVDKLETATGLRVEVESVKVDMRGSRIQARGVKLFNTPEFGGDLFAGIPFALAELRPLPLAQKRLDFQLLEFHLDELNIVKNKDGITNLQRLKLRDRSSSSFDFIGIDNLRLTLGQVHYRDLSDSSKGKNFDLNVQDEVYQNVSSWGDLAPLFLKVVLRSGFEIFSEM